MCDGFSPTRPLIVRGAAHTADLGGDVVTARGVKVVVSHNDRRRFQIATAAVAQTSHVVIPHLRQVNTQQRKVVFAHMSQEIVDLLCPQHPVVSLSAVDGCATRIGQIAHQLRVLLLRKALQHRPHPMELLHQRPFLALINIAVDLSRMIVSVGEIVVAFVLSQLLVDLRLAIGRKMEGCQRIGNRIYLTVGQIFENIHQILTRFGQ